MRRALFIGTILVGAWAFAQNQTCIVASPPSPPRAKVLTVYLPGDGGTTGCTISAQGTGATAGVPQQYPIGNAKCATSVQIADQAISLDNGWNDGGAP